MLNSNFLKNFQYWSDALNVIAHHKPEMESHFRDSLRKENVDACIWAIESLIPIVQEYSLRQTGLNILIINSWLGLPLVPLLCENMSIGAIDCIEMDERANELSRIFNKHYIANEHVAFRTLTWDTPFAIDKINRLRPDVVISLNCEQMYPLADLRVNNPYALYAMQSSQLPEEMMGINCVKSTDELTEQLALTEVFSSDQKIQEMYTWEGRKFFHRYQVIGSKRPIDPE